MNNSLNPVESDSAILVTKRSNTIFYIVRHGETEANAQKIIQGHGDAPLTQKGIEQAIEMRNELSKVNFTAAYSSDLGRAKSTAQIIIDEINIPHYTSEFIRERSFGKYEMTLYQKYFEDMKELHSVMKALPKEQRRAFKMAEDIESDEEICGRFKKFLTETASKHKGETILTVSHGGMMKALLIELDYGIYEESLNGWFNNAGYIKLITDGSEFIIEEVKGFESDQLKAKA